MNCKNCIYKKNVPGNTHIECTRLGCKPINVREHGVKNGWFMFPFLFDPIWAENCTGFIPNDWKSLSAIEKMTILLFFIKEGQHVDHIHTAEFFKDKDIHKNILEKNTIEKIVSEEENLNTDIEYCINLFKIS